MFGGIAIKIALLLGVVGAAGGACGRRRALRAAAAHIEQVRSED